MAQSNSLWRQTTTKATRGEPQNHKSGEEPFAKTQYRSAMRRKKEGGNDWWWTADEQELFLKLLMKAKQDSNLARAASTESMMVKTTSAFIVQSQRVVKTYLEEVEKAGNREQTEKKRTELGPMRLHVWNAWTQITADALNASLEQHKKKMEEAAKQEGHNEESPEWKKLVADLRAQEAAQKTLEDYKTYWVGNKDRISREVRIAKIEKAFDKTNKKLCLGVLPASNSHRVLDLMMDYIMSPTCQGRYLPGTAPKTDMEKILQKTMDGI